MTWINRLTAGFACAVGVMLAALGSPAGPALAAPVTPDEVYRQLGIDELPADYIILIDTSGSMRDGDLYGEVRHSLREFFAALAPQDRVSLISFADNAQLIWQGPAGTRPDEIVAKLPATPVGQFTDIGAGIAEAVQTLEQPGSAPIAGVVLLTDGRHEPPTGSAFPFTEGYAWRELTRRAAALPQQVNSYAIQLRGASGATQLQKVFPQAELLQSGSVDQLTERLEQPKAGVRATKARNLLADELTSGLAVEWPTSITGLAHGANDLTVTLRATTRNIPIEVTDLAIRSDRAAVSATVQSGPVTIPPGGAVTVPAVVHWDAGPYHWRPAHQVTEEVPLELTGRVGSPWSEVLTGDIRADFRPTMSGGAAVGRGSAQRGSLGRWLGAGLVLAVLVAIGAVFRWWRIHPVPRGTLAAAPVAGALTGGEMLLRQRRATISAASMGISGSGSVTGRRRNARSSDTYLSIAYSRDGSAENRQTGECPPGGSVELNDVRFEWRR